MHSTKKIKQYGIIGLGETGYSISAYLTKQKIPHTIFSPEKPSNNLREKLKKCQPYATLICGPLDEHQIKQIKTIYLSPGISPHQPLWQNLSQQGMHFYNDVDLFCSQRKKNLIAITGSNGKSTLVALLTCIGTGLGYHMEKGGNLMHHPLLELLNQPEPDYTVIELSSFQLHTIQKAQFKVGCFLNIYPNHLDWHQTMTHYQQSKQRLFHFCQHAVCYLDQQETHPKNNLACSYFSDTSTNQQTPWQIIKKQGIDYLAYQNQCLGPWQQWPQLSGCEPNTLLAALTIGSQLQWPADKMYEALAHFRSLEHRCQIIAHHKKTTWINDSKSTNARALAHALKQFGPQCDIIHLIVGGIMKTNDDFSLCYPLIKKHVTRTTCFGQDASILADLFKPYTQITQTKTLKEACQKMNPTSEQKKTCVLFSPGCASFDQFTHFEARGNHFIKIIQNDLCNIQ